MSTAFTQDTLKTAIKNHAEDQGVNFANNLDLIIALGEDRVVRELQLIIFQARDDVEIVQGQQTVTKPTGALAVYSVYYMLSGERQFLEPRTHSLCLDYAPNVTESAPKYFSEEYAETEIYIAPAPDLTVTAEAFYLKRPDGLAAINNGTWISLNVGDLLLAACMIAGERYNIDAEKVQMWTQDYPILLLSAQHQFKHLLPKNYANIAAIPMSQ
jgi:hypothetical protein